jgi:steroid delta-isomerase
MDIKEVLVFGDVAVVRLVWTLTVKLANGASVESVEPGMDIFKKQADGSWQIIRYMAYERE